MHKSVKRTAVHCGRCRTKGTNLPAWTERTPQSPPRDTSWPERTSCPWWDWWCSGRRRDSALSAWAPSVLWWTSSSLPETWAHTQIQMSLNKTTEEMEKFKECLKKQETKVRDWAYFDWVRTPMTSAYRSAMMCTLPVLGPQYLSSEAQRSIFFLCYLAALKRTTHNNFWTLCFVEAHSAAWLSLLI